MQQAGSTKEGLSRKFVDGKVRDVELVFAHHVPPHVVFDGGPVGAGGAVEGPLPRVGADVAVEVAAFPKALPTKLTEPPATGHLLKNLNP